MDSPEGHKGLWSIEPPVFFGGGGGGG